MMGTEGDSSTHPRALRGPRHLLGRGHSLELEICLHYSHGFLSPDYSVFDHGGMSFSEANLKLW